LPIHPALRLEWPRREACPEHAAGGGRVAAGDAELKGIIDEARAPGDAPDVRHRGGEGGRAGEVLEKVASFHWRVGAGVSLGLVGLVDGAGEQA
jgi:hypothetical protein